MGYRSFIVHESDIKTNMSWILGGADSLIKHYFDVKMDEINNEQLLKWEHTRNKKCFQNDQTQFLPCQPQTPSLAHAEIMTECIIIHACDT